MADYLLDHCDVPLRFKDMHKSKVNVGFPLPSDLNVDLADWRMASRRSFRDYLRKVFEIDSASCMVVQLFGDIKEITIWGEAGFMVGEKRLALFLLQFSLPLFVTGFDNFVWTLSL
uniref:Uncharacterized protein n=1 Tax=Oryza rufipogon TaxID=4529 RepID=A0A0E0N1C7_ORYRU